MIRWIGSIGTAGWLVARAARGIIKDAAERDELALDRVSSALSRFLWQPLPVLIVLALLTGVAAGEVAIRVLRVAYFEEWVERGFAHALAYHVVPLLLGIFAAGRVAVETTSRIGGMRLNRELDALVAIGQDPVRFVVTPTLAAVLVAAPLQTLIAFAAAWLGFGTALAHAGISSFTKLSANTLGSDRFIDLLAGGGKTMLYSILALGVGAAIGSDDRRGLSALSGQAMAAFTFGLLAVLSAAVVLLLLA